MDKFWKIASLAIFYIFCYIDFPLINKIVACRKYIFERDAYCRARARILIKFAFKMRSSFNDAACFIPHDFRPDESGLTKSGKQGEGEDGKKEENRSRSWWVPTLALSSCPSFVAATFTTLARKHSARRKAFVYVRLEELIRVISQKNRPRLRGNITAGHWQRVSFVEFRSSRHRCELSDLQRYDTYVSHVNLILIFFERRRLKSYLNNTRTFENILYKLNVPGLSRVNFIASDNVCVEYILP